MVCVNLLRPVRMLIEDEDENMELEESKLYYESIYERGFSDTSDIDDDNELIDRNELPKIGDDLRLPRHISVVSPDQQQQIIDQYFDMNCDFCKASFQTLEEAIQHYEVKHNNQRGYVKCCSLKFPRPFDFHSHIVWHLNPELFKCQTCGEVKKTYQSYRQHELKHFKQFTCDICQKVFTVFTSLERHILTAHANKAKFPCDQCDQSFNTQKHLEIHLEVTHSNGLEDYINEIKCMEFNISEVQIKSTIEGYFDRKCEQCDAQLDSITMAKSHHLSEHKNPKGYLRCCGNKMFNNKGALDHVQWHIDPETYRCRACKLEHMHRYTLIDHLKRHNALSTKKFSCNVCDRYFRNTYEYRSHMERKHPGIQPSSSSVETNSYNNPDIFRCGVCNKSLPNRYSLKQHNDWHSNKYYCHTCQKSFKLKNLLKDHLEIHCEKQRNFICVVCDKGFLRQHQLNTHRKRHDPKHNQICEFCAKKFKTKTKLKLHQAKHLDVAPKTKPKFQCDICNVWYTSKGILKAHKMKHDAEPQKCSQCDKITPNPHALEQHIRRNHSDTILNCHLCEKSFKLPASLRDHIATHLNNKSHKCTYCDMTFVWRQNMYKHRKQMHEEEWLADKGKK